MNNDNNNDLLIRKFVNAILTCTRERLIDEDEEYTKDAQEEVSAGGVAGVTTPLGTGPTYPNIRKHKKKKKN